MTLAWALRLLGAWTTLTAALCVALHARVAMAVDPAHPVAVVGSVWSAGRRVERVALAPGATGDPRLSRALEAHPGATLVLEDVTGEGAVLAEPELLLAMSVVPGQDGLEARLDGRTAYATVDDLLSRRAYDRGFEASSLQLGYGLHVPVALALLGDDLGVPVRELLDRGELRRVRVRRREPSHEGPRSTPVDLRAAALAAARYLARGTDASGHLRYLVSAPDDRTLPGYDWPRHGGATYFLAQATALDRTDADLANAARRAAALLRDHALTVCGPHACIGSETRVDVGSTALGLLAFIEVARSGLDPGYARLVPELAAFLRAQQRPDGELMHLFDRASGKPVDVQFLYSTGEAALALARAHELRGDPRDLDAASRALAHLVGPAWSFAGDRYYWGEEHWTCQAMDELWGRGPRSTEDRALEFCLRWAAYGRRLMYGPGETLYDADGAYGFGPVLTPRLTPASSRSEAALATLDAARRAGRPAAELAPLEDQVRRSLAMLVRHQLHPGPAYLFEDPGAIDGAMPGSEVDWALRIDYAQHAGSAWIRALAEPPP